MRYTVNGRTYDSLEAMPKDDRAVFERMRGLVDDPELLGGAELVDGESPMLGWTPPQAAPERAAGEGVGRRALELLSDVEIESARERMRAESAARSRMVGSRSPAASCSHCRWDWFVCVRTCDSGVSGSSSAPVSGSKPRFECTRKPSGERSSSISSDLLRASSSVEPITKARPRKKRMSSRARPAA